MISFHLCVFQFCIFCGVVTPFLVQLCMEWISILKKKKKKSKKGEAVKVKWNFEHLAATYKSANEILERKYWGMCRQIALNMEGPNQFQKDWKIGRDAVVINLREQGSDSKN